MQEVTKEDFFREISGLDVHPRVRESTLKDRVHVSDWETRRRVVVGRTEADTWQEHPTRYFLKQRDYGGLNR